MVTFLTFAALLIVLGFSYMPAKKALRKFLDHQHNHIMNSLQAAEKQYYDARDFYQKVQKNYEENIRLNETKLVDFKTDLQEVNKEKISKIRKILKRNLEMMRILYQKDVVDLSELLLHKQMRLSIDMVLKDFHNNQKQNLFMLDQLRQIN